MTDHWALAVIIFAMLTASLDAITGGLLLLTLVAYCVPAITG